MAAIRSQGNSTLTFNSNSLTNYVRNVTVTANGNSIDITSLGDTANVSLTDNPTWEVSAELAFWDSTVDGYLTPEIITPGTKRTLVVAKDDGATTVTLTWTSNAEVGQLTLPSAVGAVHNGSVTFRCSGAPTRTTA